MFENVLASQFQRAENRIDKCMPNVEQKPRQAYRLIFVGKLGLLNAAVKVDSCDKQGLKKVQRIRWVHLVSQTRNIDICAWCFLVQPGARKASRKTRKLHLSGTTSRRIRSQRVEKVSLRQSWETNCSREGVNSVFISYYFFHYPVKPCIT
jgi:hypothetical protein